MLLGTRPPLQITVSLVTSGILYLKIRNFDECLRRHGDRLEVGRGRVLARNQLSVNVAVQLGVDVVVALVLEGRTARRTFKALHVQVFVFYAHEHTAIEKKRELNKQALFCLHFDVDINSFSYYFEII